MDDEPDDLPEFHHVRRRARVGDHVDFPCGTQHGIVVARRLAGTRTAHGVRKHVLTVLPYSDHDVLEFAPFELGSELANPIPHLAELAAARAEVRAGWTDSQQALRSLYPVVPAQVAEWHDGHRRGRSCSHTQTRDGLTNGGA